jgi:hypothetical protein
MKSTEDARKMLAELLEIPLDEVLHYALIVHIRGQLGVQFCGMPRQGIRLLADGISFMAANMADLEAAKMEIGASLCHEYGPGGGV